MLIQSALVALGATLAAAVPSLEIQGNQFVNPKTGYAFQVVGVAYQPGGSGGYKPNLGYDPLSNATACLRDAALMQILGINTIRVYNLSPDLNHDECASIFNAAGMYMMLDVNSPLPGESLYSLEPWTTYNKGYLNRTFAIVEAFKSYPNTLAFFSGNEVINQISDAKYAPPYIRAVTRDLKSYIAKYADRKIPVGYSAADVREVLFDTYNYLSCAVDGDEDDLSRADLFALNSYSWCGQSSFETSGYNQLIGNFTGNSIPIFFSEFGCNKPSPRVFTEISTIYGDQMMPVFSGGIVYEYVQETNNFGLVDLSDDSAARVLEDYYTLKSQYAKVDFKTVESSKARTNTPKPKKCDASLIKVPKFDTNFTVPVMPDDGSKDLLSKGISSKPVGKIVDVSEWKVKATVLNTDNNTMSDLEVKKLAADAYNLPGTNSPESTSSSPGNGTSGNSTSSGKGDDENAALGARGLGKSATYTMWAVGAAYLGMGIYLGV